VLNGHGEGEEMRYFQAPDGQLVLAEFPPSFHVNMVVVMLVLAALHTPGIQN
jgi:hypothetical protein